MSNKGRMVALLVTTLLATLAITAAGTAAQASDSFNQIPNYGNRKCLDVAAENNFYVQLWHCIGGDNQQLWSHAWLATDFDIQFGNKASGGCLGVEGDSTAVGARVVMLPCWRTSSVWHQIYANNENFDGWHQQYQNKNSGLCLDLQWNDSQDGRAIWQWPCTDQLTNFNSAQLWMLLG